MIVDYRLYRKIVQVNLLKIKKEHPKLDYVFSFLDELTSEIKKNKSEKNNNTLIFNDYVTKKLYYIDIKLANSILRKVFNNFYFKPIFEKTKIYFDLRQIFISNNLYNFDLFFVAFFLEIKKKQQHFNYDFFKEKLLDCGFLSSDIFIIQESLKILNNKYNFLELPLEFYSISSETFQFRLKPSKNNEDYVRAFHYLDLIDLLTLPYYSRNLNNIEKIDKCLQLIVSICFVNARFIKNNPSDNIFIKNLINY